MKPQISKAFFVFRPPLHLRRPEKIGLLRVTIRATNIALEADGKS
jgi:hypothetical protein